ncbi:MAG: Calx-beta domain protein [bacterium ADurb.Bin400]|nr:MAG: Calx-beta domain protein [bacterium ADurb.Bin400]
MLNTDYTAPASIAVSPDNLTNTGSISASPDNNDEDEETVIVDVDTVTNGTEDGTQQFTAVITDDDDPPTVSLSLTGSPMPENGGQATVTATLSVVSGKTVTVELTYSGTAIRGTDYIANSTITINPGSPSSSVTITAQEDDPDEEDETVIVDIDTVTNAAENGAQQVTATITDNDNPPAITLSVIGNVMGENSDLARVSASPAIVSGKTITVTVTFGGTATINSDYTASGNTLTINPGQSQSDEITITGINENYTEVDETVIVSIDNVTNGTTGDPSTVTITIVDDDGISSSETYAMPDFVVGAGGQTSASEQYKLDDTVGEPDTDESRGSETYKIKSGFWNLNPLSSAISLSASLETIVLGGIIGSGKSNESNLSANSVILNVETANTNGYNLSWRTTAATSRTNATLENEYGDTINAISVGASPSLWPDLASSSGWGARLGLSSTTYDSSAWGDSDTYSLGKWLGITNIDHNFISRNSATSVEGDDEVVILGAEIGANKIQPTGAYTVNVIFTATTID